MQPKILVIRGGAIGDFLLTLPAIRLLREAFPAARLEVLGYEHIVAIAVSGGLADAARSIEYGPMSAFFNPRAELDPDLSAYFAGFQQVVSYLYDPDGFFSGNLRRCGVKHLIEASPKIDAEGEHAARQLARPLERLALYLEDADAAWQPGREAEGAAAEFLRAADGQPFIAIHPGSGGERKNWPPERWLGLARWLLGLPECPRLLVVAGEADARAITAFRAVWQSLSPPGVAAPLLAENLPLPQLGAVLARSRLFIGHDSGISHLAATAGAPCVLLFGPTDPEIWAPTQQDVNILCAPDGDLAALSLEEVRAAVAGVLRPEPG